MVRNLFFRHQGKDPRLSTALEDVLALVSFVRAWGVRGMVALHPLMPPHDAFLCGRCAPCSVTKTHPRSLRNTLSRRCFFARHA